MGKILQVIKKDSNFQNGKVKINLYETSFKTLSKVCGNVPGQTVQNAAVGQVIGYQVFRDLNKLQYAVRQKLEDFKNQYNSWINSNKTKVSNLLNFDYIFTSMTQNYSNSIVENTKLDMLLIEKLADPEKELYDFTIKSDSSMQENLSKLREWSKSKPYGLNINSMTGNLYFKAADESFRLFRMSGLATASISSPQVDSALMNISNINSMPIGSVTKWDLVVIDRFGAEDTTYHISVTKYESGIENDCKIEYNDGGRGSTFYQKKHLSGNPSPHFNTSNVNLKFLKSRVLI